MPLPEWKKILILVVGLLEILIFSGTILGWTSLKLMLKNEGIYDYKCRNSSAGRLVIGEGRNNSGQSLAPLTPVVAIGSNQSLPSETSLTLAAPASASLANISLQLNLTISTDRRQDDNGKVSAAVANGGSNSLKRTIVIPFQAATDSLNQSVIYTLLRDSSVVLRSNRSDIELSLFSNTLDRHKDNSDNVSTLEQFIHLYMTENLEPVVSRLLASWCKQ